MLLQLHLPKASDTCAHKINDQIYIGSFNPVNIESFKLSSKVATAVSVVSGVQNYDNDGDSDDNSKQ